jgi:hypothetical protein
MHDVRDESALGRARLDPDRRLEHRRSDLVGLANLSALERAAVADAPAGRGLRSRSRASTEFPHYEVTNRDSLGPIGIEPADLCPKVSRAVRGAN